MYRGLNIVEAFANDPCDRATVWRGESFLELSSDAAEIIPVNYFGHRYLIAFSCLSEGIRDCQDDILEGAGIQNFSPSENYRFIKFWPSEAETDHRFDYDHWELPRGTGFNALHFCNFLSQIVATHAHIYEDCSQYFFIPAHEKLDRLYSATYKRYFQGPKSYLSSKLVLKQLTTSGGVCYGYERT